jgi:hypothetical protein
MPQTLPPELAQLKDVHELAAISWWPPAIGWWIVAGLLLIGVIAALIYIYPRWRLRSYRQFFLKQLQHIQQTKDDTQTQRLNFLMKKLALLAFPRTQVAGLTGKAWANFLREQGPKNRTLTTLQQVLGEQQFQSAAIDAPELWKDAQAWVCYVLHKQRQHILHYRQQKTAQVQESAC